jgi:hypothetical protein
VKLFPRDAMKAHRGCETSRLADFLESRLTDGGEGVGLMRLPRAISGQTSTKWARHQDMLAG